MTVALLADVHANARALEAVLEEAAAARADRVVCLGDVVGYGPRPSECVRRLAAAASWVVAGNHDRDVVDGESLPGTNGSARLAQRWTRDRLDPADRAWLAALPNRVVDGAGFVGVHGCYLNEEHVSGYVTGSILEANLRAVAVRGEWPRIALCGHTHVPMCGWLTAGGCEESGDRPAARWPANARAVLVNPGSVGQPRDGDPRASWALLELEARRVEFRRTAYDVEKTALEILEAGLPAANAERLREGR